MLNFAEKRFWAACLAAALVSVSYADQNQAGRQLNPYHEKQLQEQIQKCASGVLACSDAELRCVKQQELCQLLIRSERFDEALQVAHNVFKTQEAGDERRAAHHFLVAEIYNRKMQASTSLTDMEKNRQYALSAAQEVVERKYPSKWGVSEHARNLIQDLSDSTSMARVRQRVTARQGLQGDSTKEAIADAQRKYLDATQGRGASAPSAATNGAQFTRRQAVQATERPEESRKEQASVQVEDVSKLPSTPTVQRTLSPNRYEAGATMQVSSRLQSTGLLTSQAGKSATATGGAPGNTAAGGGVVNTAEAIAQNNLNQLLEDAKRRRAAERKSPYATGQMPSTGR